MNTEYKTLSETSDEKVVKIVTDWLTGLQLERRMSPKTVESYGIDIREFLSFMKDYRSEKISVSLLRQFQVSDFRAFLMDQTEREKTRSSIARVMSA
ncbi:MAG: site-specific integrase, partial [Pseudomonadota bacterium]|nr:site-specific integrase [Pseudomonadota bacterium]